MDLVSIKIEEAIKNGACDREIVEIIKLNMVNRRLILSNLQSKHRAVLHRIASQYNMGHTSSGDYSNRVLILEDNNHKYFLWNTVENTGCYEENKQEEIKDNDESMEDVEDMEDIEDESDEDESDEDDSDEDESMDDSDSDSDSECSEDSVTNVVKTYMLSSVRPIDRTIYFMCCINTLISTYLLFK